MDVCADGSWEVVGSCQERESEQPLCFSREGQSCKMTQIWQMYVKSVQVGVKYLKVRYVLMMLGEVR